MIRRRPLIAATVAAASMLAFVAGPSGADETTITVTIAGGNLTIDAPDTVTGSGAVNSVVTVDVPSVAIADERGSLLGWTATASATDLTTGGGDETGETILAASLLWGTDSITPHDEQAAISLPAGGSLGVSSVIAVGAPLLSPGAFTVDGAITVPVPVTARAGEYTGTLTTTIS
ncbi:hypothetical protein [Euzebya rosea]|uniref:hypothetical protein n=1 Tax=Euzebya rosea TaxID=2052804 RepID=UPI000D3EB0D5|nr:hypothetical protein [Euzebya rosea]